MVCIIELYLVHNKCVDESYVVERLIDIFIFIFEVEMAYFVYANPIGVSWALPDLIGSFDFLLKCLEASVVVLTSPIYIWVPRLIFVNIDNRGDIDIH